MITNTFPLLFISFLLICALTITDMVAASSFIESSLNAINNINSRSDIIANVIKMDDYKNSSFPSYSFIMGDMATYDIKDSTCVEMNGTFVKLKTSGNSMTIATVYRPNDVMSFTNCVQVKEDYHLCSIMVGGSTSTACLKIDDDMNTDGEFEMAINLNPLACVNPSFDLEPKCDLKSLDIISVYSYPGESATKLRNYAVVAVLIVVFVCVSCIVLCGLIAYCWLIRRRRQKLLGGGANMRRNDTELVDEEE